MLEENEATVTFGLPDNRIFSICLETFYPERSQLPSPEIVRNRSNPVEEGKIEFLQEVIPELSRENSASSSLPQKHL